VGGDGDALGARGGEETGSDGKDGQHFVYSSDRKSSIARGIDKWMDSKGRSSRSSSS
jgi:hypothetical protein